MLVVLNKYKSAKLDQETNFLLDQGLHLKTCLRKTVLFSEAEFEILKIEDINLTKGFDVYTGYSAVEYMVKILSGLESPVVGETEVLGQFKKQVVPQLKEKPDLEEIVQFILNLVKLVRTKHLVGLGSQSYGSMVRKILKGDRHIVFVGAGALVESILPWVKKSKNIMVLVRSLQRFQKTNIFKENKDLKIFSLKEKFKFDFPLNVVVCAPIKARFLEKYLENSNVQTVIDLREESREDPILNLSCKIFDLEKIFEEVNSGDSKKEKLIKSIEEDICCKIEEKLIKHRPFGWDDLCL